MRDLGVLQVSGNLSRGSVYRPTSGPGAFPLWLEYAHMAL